MLPTRPAPLAPSILLCLTRCPAPLAPSVPLCLTRCRAPPRTSRAAYHFIVNLIIPGTPLLCLVLTFANDNHPDVLGAPPADPYDPSCDWQPFDFVMHRWGLGGVLGDVTSISGYQCGLPDL